MSNEFTHLWNDLPFEERSRLTPYTLESQKAHILQCKAKAVKAHNRHMRELDDWVKSLDEELARYSREASIGE